MQKFLDFITEGTGLKGNIGSDPRGVSHIKNYIFPYLSHDQRKQSLKNMAQHMNPDKDWDHMNKPYAEGAHGAKHVPDASATHTLAVSHKDPLTGNVYGAGTPVKATGVRHDQKNNLFVQTANHGEVPMSKIQKPAELKKENKNKGGYDVESTIAKHLGVKAAGSTGAAYDYAYRGGEDGGVKGKVRKLDDDKPIVRGESKQNKAIMGQTVIKHDPVSKKWDFITGDKAHLAHIYQNSIHPKSKLPILEHLNKHHPEGRVEQGISAPAPAGSTRSYLSGLGVNSLHLHLTDKKKKIDHGTTYTVGDNNDLKGKTNLSHLSNKELDSLDGNVSLEKTTNGSLRIAHRPNFGSFRNYANMSKDKPDQHKDLTNEEHAKEFRKHVDEHIFNKNKFSLMPELKPKAAPVKKEVQKTVSPKPKLLKKIVNGGPVSQNVRVQKLAKQAQTNKKSKEIPSNDGTFAGFKF